MSVKVTMKMKKCKLMTLAKIKITTVQDNYCYVPFIAKRNSRLSLSFKDVLKNKKKNMEQINYNKLQYDTTRNKHFMMIEPPGPNKHLSTLKDCY